MKKAVIFIGVFIVVTISVALNFIRDDESVIAHEDSLVLEKEKGSGHVSSSSQMTTAPMQKLAVEEINSLSNNSGSLENKLARERELDEKMAAESLGDTVEQIVIELRSKGIDLPEYLLKKLQAGNVSPTDFAELRAYVDKALPAGEAEFRDQMLGYGMSYSEINSAYENRSKVTGLSYEQEMVNNRNIYKDITYDELKALLIKGNRLPQDIVTTLAGANRVELLQRLNEDGYIAGLNYINPFTHKNALEEYVEKSVLNPNANSGESINAVNSIVQLGVNPVPQDGTRDALDYVLENVTEVNVETVALISKKLIDSGVDFQDSHVYLMNKIKINYPDAYDKYFQGYFGHYVSN